MARILFICDKGRFPRLEEIYNRVSVDTQLIFTEDMFCDFKPLDYDLVVIKSRALAAILFGKFAESCGVKVINRPKAIELTNNKILMDTVLREKHVPMLDACFLTRTQIDKVPDRIFPCMLKPAKGERAEKVALIENKKQLESVEQDLLYLQKFVPSEEEIKIYFVGKKLFSAKQKPVFFFPDKLKTRVEIQFPHEIKKQCKKIVKASGLKIGGVDFLKEKENYWFIDMNPFPGFRGITGAYEFIAHYLENKAKG